MISKIIYSIIYLYLLAFLTISTYTWSITSSFEKPYYEKYKLGSFELNKIKWKDENSPILFSEKELFSSNTGSIIIKKINISDKILFQSWSIKTQLNNNNIIITINKWIYFFDLKEINKEYTIIWKGFEIKNKWPWNFFINNLNPSHNIIFSFNSLLDLTLKNIKSNKTMANLDLYPNTYLIFNPKINFLLKNADLLKISQRFTLW